MLFTDASMLYFIEIVFHILHNFVIIYGVMMSYSWRNDECFIGICPRLS